MDMLKLSPFPSVAANAKAVYSSMEFVNRGLSLHALIFKMGGTFTRANVSRVKVRAGGKDLVDDITGAQLQTVNSYLGFPSVAEYFAIPFGNPRAETIRGKHLGDVDLTVYTRSPLEIEIDIGAATSPTLDVFALVAPPKREMGIGFGDVEALTVRALVPTVIDISAAVSRQAHDLNVGSALGARVRGLHFFHSNLTAVELRKAGLTKWDDILVADADYASNLLGGRDQTSGHYAIDFVADGAESGAMPTVRSDGAAEQFQTRFTTSGADTIRAFADVYSAIELL